MQAFNFHATQIAWNVLLRVWLSTRQTLDQKPLTLTVAGELVKPLAEAVMVMVPLAPWVAVAVTKPAETVAILVLLDTHVATAVMSCPPLHEAVKAKLGVLAVREVLLGFMIGALVQATETVRG
jgi:type III secretory pathway component EscT